jgi:hypothetical protein
MLYYCSVSRLLDVITVSSYMFIADHVGKASV